MDDRSPFPVDWRDGWRRFFANARARPRARRRQRARRSSWAAPIDPVALTVLAVNQLGPATIRAVSLGLPVTIAAPDHETAEIFRAALARMQRTRPTDRLVSIAFAGEG